MTLRILHLVVVAKFKIKANEARADGAASGAANMGVCEDRIAGRLSPKFNAEIELRDSD